MYASQAQHTCSNESRARSVLPPPRSLVVWSIFGTSYDSGIHQVACTTSTLLYYHTAVVAISECNGSCRVV